MVFCSNKLDVLNIFYSDNNVLHSTQAYLMENAGNKKCLFCLIDYTYRSANFHQILFVSLIVSVPVNSKP